MTPPEFTQFSIGALEVGVTYDAARSISDTRDSWVVERTVRSFIEEHADFWQQKLVANPLVKEPHYLIRSANFDRRSGSPVLNQLEGELSYHVGNVGIEHQQPLKISPDGWGMLSVIQVTDDATQTKPYAVVRPVFRAAVPDVVLGIHVVKRPEGSQSLLEWGKPHFSSALNGFDGGRVKEVKALPPQYAADGSWTARTFLHIARAVMTKNDFDRLKNFSEARVLSTRQAVEECLGSAEITRAAMTGAPVPALVMPQSVLSKMSVSMECSLPEMAAAADGMRLRMLNMVRKTNAILAS